MIILTAFGTMLDIVKPADALKRIGAILGIVIVLMLAPGVLAGVWSAMSLWQQFGIVILGIIIGLVFCGTRKGRKKKRE